MLRTALLRELEAVNVVHDRSWGGCERRTSNNALLVQFLKLECKHGDLVSVSGANI